MSVINNTYSWKIYISQFFQVLLRIIVQYKILQSTTQTNKKKNGNIHLFYCTMLLSKRGFIYYHNAKIQSKTFFYINLRGKGSEIANKSL